MAKKRRVIRRRKSAVKEKSSNVVGRVISSKFKLGIVFRNLILFVLLAVISYILYNVSWNDVFINLFYFLWIIFAFISLAFFIALLVLLFMRWMKR
jgi:hypothetical protein